MRDTAKIGYVGDEGEKKRIQEKIAKEFEYEKITHPNCTFIDHNPRQVIKIGRNAPCPCGSGRKYKRCCYGKA